MKTVETTSGLSFRRYIPAMISLFSLLLIAVAPSISEARGPQGEGMFAERMLGHLQYRLKLTPEQMEKVTPIVQEESNKIRELRDQHHQKLSDMRAEFRKEMATQHDQMRERLEGILTPEQKAEFHKMDEERQAWRHKFSENRDHRGPHCGY